MMMFLLKICKFFNQPFAKRSPLNNYAFNLYSSLSFYAYSIRDSLSIQISSLAFFAASKRLKLNSVKV
ncbi:hypothetical protein GQ44DRAFT_717212, partial [Phaeosphaeriaceae sp. PMI808]